MVARVAVLAAAHNVQLPVEATNDLIPLVSSPENRTCQIRPCGGVHTTVEAHPVRIEFDAFAFAARYAFARHDPTRPSNGRVG